MEEGHRRKLLALAHAFPRFLVACLRHSPILHVRTSVDLMSSVDAVEELIYQERTVRRDDPRMRPVGWGQKVSCVSSTKRGGERNLSRNLVELVDGMRDRHGDNDAVGGPVRAMGHEE